MPENYTKLFNCLKTKEVPDHLYQKVMDRIGLEQSLAAIRRKVYIYTSATILCFSALSGAFYFVRLEMASSGFLSYFSLLFSDLDVVLSSWQNFSLTLLEAMPATSIILFLLSMAVLMHMAKNLAKNIQLFNKPRILMN
jgi:hypothetical protein